MASKALPSPEVLRQLLRYYPETGKLFWLPRPVEMFSDRRTSKIWNTKYAGREAITANCNGYRYGQIRGKMFYAHRLAWVLNTGEWPAEQIDHINGNKTDNRIENLRSASPQNNARNRPANRTGNSSGAKGVTAIKSTGRWQAQIGDGAQTRYLGTFDSVTEAHEAYKRAAILIHGEFARLE